MKTNTEFFKVLLQKVADYGDEKRVQSGDEALELRVHDGEITTVGVLAGAGPSGLCNVQESNDGLEKAQTTTSNGMGDAIELVDSGPVLLARSDNEVSNGDSLTLESRQGGNGGGCWQGWKAKVDAPAGFKAGEAGPDRNEDGRVRRRGWRSAVWFRGGYNYKARYW